MRGLVSEKDGLSDRNTAKFAYLIRIILLIMATCPANRQP